MNASAETETETERFELHAHTTCSDGVLVPAELVERALAHGVSVLALTDHDTVAGFGEAREAGERLGVEVLAGVELTCGDEGRELHLLGYLRDPEEPTLLAALAQLCEERRQRAREIVQRLCELGRPVDGAGLEGLHAPTRAHVARLLVEGRHVRTYRQAFDRWLSAGRPAYVPKPLLSVADAVGLVHGAGGVSVLAHPGGYREAPVLRDLAPLGLDGVEAYYPSHSPQKVRGYVATARALGWIVTGGSDFHAPGGRCELGAHPVPAEVLPALRARLAARR